VRSVSLRAWVVSAAALALAGAGVTSLAAGSAVTSLPRMAVAAGILAAYTALVALVVTPRAERTWARCLLWGGLVPALVAMVTLLLVGAESGVSAGLLRSLPWLLGALPVCLGGRWLPALPSLSKLWRPSSS
jgi:hypothetical protein